MRFILVLIIFTALPLEARTVLKELIKVNPYTLPGDSVQNPLPVTGLRWHESNDFLGRTDKLMTQTSSLNVTIIH